MAKSVSKKTGKRRSKAAPKRSNRPMLARDSKGRFIKQSSNNMTEGEMSKGSTKKSSRPILKRDSKGRYMKQTMNLKKAGPSGRTVTKVRHQTKNKNIEHGIKRNNTKKHVDTKRKDSVRQKRNQHVKTKRRTKGKHEEEREMTEEM